jgi:hypothetical protein
VKHCGSISPDVRDYFHRDLDRSAQNRRARQQQSMLREEVAADGNVVHNINSDNDEELQCAIHLSRDEAQYAQRVRQQGGQYEHGGGSSQQQPSGDRLKRSSSRRGRSQPVQIRIDTGPWTTKGKQAKSVIGKAWLKYFHTEVIPGAKADNSYFVVACKEMQRWGKLGCHLIYLHLSSFIVFMYYFCIFCM